MQPAYDCKAPDKHIELLNFEVEVISKLQTGPYDLSDEETVTI